MARKEGILSAIKKDVERTGSNRGKFFYVKSGAKARIRFLDDLDDGRVVSFHDRWDPQLKVPCKKNWDEDAECEYCDDESIRKRDMYVWSVWDYDASEVKLFMYAANQCSPVPTLAAMQEQFGTITDRDYSIGRSGSGTNTSYSLIPLDKSKFRNSKAKPFSDKAFWKALEDAYSDPDDDKDDDDEEEETERVTKSKSKSKSKTSKSKSKRDDDDEADNLPWEDDEDDEDDDDEVDYDEMSAKELYALCKERGISVKPRKAKEFYISKLDDTDDDDDDDDFWEE